MSARGWSTATAWPSGRIAKGVWAAIAPRRSAARWPSGSSVQAWRSSPGNWRTSPSRPSARNRASTTAAPGSGRPQVLDGRVAPPQPQVEPRAGGVDLDLARLGNGVGRLNSDGVRPGASATIVGTSPRGCRPPADWRRAVHSRPRSPAFTAADRGTGAVSRGPSQPAKARATRQEQQDTDQDNSSARLGRPKAMLTGSASRNWRMSCASVQGGHLQKTCLWRDRRPVYVRKTRFRKRRERVLTQNLLNPCLVDAVGQLSKF